MGFKGIKKIPKGHAAARPRTAQIRSFTGVGDYDRILKENIAALLLPLSEKLLGFTVYNPRPLPEKLQTTVEREPDFLKQVSLADGRQIILHLEFQRTDEADMVYRMAEYRAIVQRKFRLPMRQYVIYLGTGQPRMATQLSPDEQIKGFGLRNLHALPLEGVLTSSVPEEIVLAILSDYPAADAEQVVRRIIDKLRSAAPDEAALRKNLTQLRTLSRLRKLEEVTTQQIATMPITYDIKTDYLYLRGKAEAEAEAAAQLAAKQKAFEDQQRAFENQQRASVIKMLRQGSLSEGEIADFLNVTIDYVRQVKAEAKL